MAPTALCIRKELRSFGHDGKPEGTTMLRIVSCMLAAATIQAWVTRSNLRRSIMSASAPAGRMTRKTGSVVAACTSPTINGETVSCVISPKMPLVFPALTNFPASDVGFLG